MRKPNISFLLSCIYVGIAGIAVGFVVHFLVVRNNPGLDVLLEPIVIVSIVFAVLLIFFIFWWVYILFCFLFFRQKITIKKITSFAILDSYSCFPFYVFFAYKYMLGVLSLLPFILILFSFVLKLILFSRNLKISKEFGFYTQGCMFKRSMKARVVSSIGLFKKNLKYLYDTTDRNIYSIIDLFKANKIPLYISKIHSKITSYIAHCNYDDILNAAYKGLKIFLIIYIVFIGLSRLHYIYNIPLEKPYFTGGVDEPFSINAGINILKNKGNSLFYNYGGTSSYPFAMSFGLYSLAIHKTPYYKYFGEKFYFAAFPQRWDTYPVKPIYYAKIFAVIFFVILSILFVSLFSWHLLPIPFFLFAMIDYSQHMNFYRDKLMGNTHIAFAASITCLFFILAIISISDTKKYFKYMYICFICASIAAAVKLTGLATFIFPFSLFMYVYLKNDFKFISGKKILAKVLLCSLIPYIILTPAVILDLGRYIAWLQKMLVKGKINPMEWLDPERIKQLLLFVKDLYFLKSVPEMLIVILLISSTVFFIKIHPIFFIAIFFFHLFTLQTIITNTGDFPFSRLYTILLFTPVMFLFFPLIYAYNKSVKYFKFFIVFICTVITLFTYSPKVLSLGFGKLIKGEFNKNWTKESRDELVEYAQSKKLELFFFDFHSFSLPENIDDRRVFFQSTDELPSKLKNNQIICFIKYNKPTPGERMDKEYEHYSKVTAALLKKYEVVKIFGNDKPLYEWNCTGNNPTIVCLKEK